jgi:hypothetical protein
MITLRPYQEESLAALPKRVADITGKRSGMLVVASFVTTGHKGRAVWLCRCDCGNEKQISAENIVRGKAKSCGCKTSFFQSKSLTTHGQSRTKSGKPTGAWSSWNAMISRCKHPKNAQFHDYGGRGIRVCERWESFTNFFLDMGPRPEGMSLDRINPNGNYEPSNCRWTTPKQQTANRRPNVKNADADLLLKAAKAVISAPKNDVEGAIKRLSDAVARFEARGQK